MLDHDVIFTAETHNFPSGVAPFPGAETGTGGRIRDVHATGRGSLVVAGTAAYCVGNLRIPGYELPWEDPDFAYPATWPRRWQIEIEASNGASDYGNKFGEPVIQGYTRSFGLRLPNGERREWIKPIMFSAASARSTPVTPERRPPSRRMWVVKIGGPAYRIGMGGGAASSMVQGENVAELDFNAVQRGDAEMEQKVNRVHPRLRRAREIATRSSASTTRAPAATATSSRRSSSRLGAGIEVRAIPVGDDTLSVLEIWGAEYQENDALLLRPEHAELFRPVRAREGAFRLRRQGHRRRPGGAVHDETRRLDPGRPRARGGARRHAAEDLRARAHRPTARAAGAARGLTVADALDRVLRLLSVGSKRFLTTKVDRSRHRTGRPAAVPARCSSPSPTWR